MLIRFLLALLLIVNTMGTHLIKPLPKFAPGLVGKCYMILLLKKIAANLIFLVRKRDFKEDLKNHCNTYKRWILQMCYQLWGIIIFWKSIFWL